MINVDTEEAAKQISDYGVRSYDGTIVGDAFLKLGIANDATIFFGKWKGQSPWEKHPGDELVQVLSGCLVMTVVQDKGISSFELKEGAFFVVPRDLWHRQESAKGVIATYVTPTPTDFSYTDSPPE